LRFTCRSLFNSFSQNDKTVQCLTMTIENFPEHFFFVKNWRNLINENFVSQMLSRYCSKFTQWRQASLE
jgi:hypothetical protein